ncbi:MAG: hypothetical protein IPM71_01725 [Bacteroidota bacterium]|nr:MAG: hypothetical protein IPM71_01725 [Bacteroidota bacterium]
MAITRRKYPSKILLFGEYGVLMGLDALAVPYFPFYGKLSLKPAGDSSVWNGFLAHLQSLEGVLPFVFKFSQLEKDIKRGLWFNSNIPYNYGLGSSGALVAAVFDSYFTVKGRNTKVDLRALKTSLALMESYFHGRSSGIDPLVSLIQNPVLVQKSGRVVLPEERILPSRRKLQLFLVDSQVPGKTGDLVTQFMDKINDLEFASTFRQAYQKHSNGAIQHLLHKRIEAFMESFRNLSTFQYENMKELIPPTVSPLFERGLSSGLYALKICGSGGGGYFLGVTKYKESVEDQLGLPVHFI